MVFGVPLIVLSFAGIIPLVTLRPCWKGLKAISQCDHVQHFLYWNTVDVLLFKKWTCEKWPYDHICNILFQYK